mgnify:CR=1 FL=1
MIEFHKYSKKKFQEHFNNQRFFASPYSAHLNFKTFEKVFDLEICGEKEMNGKTQYRLRKINPQKRQ